MEIDSTHMVEAGSLLDDLSFEDHSGQIVRYSVRDVIADYRGQVDLSDWDDLFEGRSFGKDDFALPLAAVLTHTDLTLDGFKDRVKSACAAREQSSSSGSNGASKVAEWRDDTSERLDDLESLGAETNARLDRIEQKLDELLEE